MSLRTVAAETSSAAEATTCAEPTGWPVVMYSVTIARSTARLRSSRSATLASAARAAASAGTATGTSTTTVLDTCTGVGRRRASLITRTSWSQPADGPLRRGMLSAGPHGP